MNVRANLAALISASITSTLPFDVKAQRTPFASGFSGAISLNARYNKSQSQLNTHDDNALTQNLSNKGNSINTISPMLLGRLQYNFGKTIIFLGNSEDQITEANFQAELGVTQKINSGSIITAAVFGNLPEQGEAWQDPYLTNSARIMTDQTVSGARLAWGFSKPISASVKYAYAKSEIDIDDIGLSQSISDTQRSLLARDSDYHRFGSEASFTLNSYLTISPTLYYTLRIADGKAHSFNDLSGQVALALNLPKHSFTTTIRYSVAEFHESNPVFNRKQDYRSIGVFSIYSYRNLFNFNNIALNLMVGYQSKDSDIEFYSSEDLFVTTGFSYHF